MSERERLAAWAAQVSKAMFASTGDWQTALDVSDTLIFDGRIIAALRSGLQEIADSPPNRKGNGMSLWMHARAHAALIEADAIEKTHEATK